MAYTEGKLGSTINLVLRFQSIAFLVSHIALHLIRPLQIIHSA